MSCNSTSNGILFVNGVRFAIPGYQSHSFSQLGGIIQVTVPIARAVNGATCQANIAFNWIKNINHSGPLPSPSEFDARRFVTMGTSCSRWYGRIALFRNGVSLPETSDGPIGWADSVSARAISVVWVNQPSWRLTINTLGGTRVMSFPSGNQPNVSFGGCAPRFNPKSQGGNRPNSGPFGVPGNPWGDPDNPNRGRPVGPDGKLLKPGSKPQPPFPPNTPAGPDGRPDPPDNPDRNRCCRRLKTLLNQAIIEARKR